MHKIFFKIAPTGAQAFKTAEAMEEAGCQVFSVQAVLSGAYSGLASEGSHYFWHVWGRYDVTKTSHAAIEQLVKQRTS